MVLNDVERSRAGRGHERSPPISGAGATVVGYGADVTDVSAVRGMVEAIVERHHRLDVAVVNAGVSHFGPFLDEEPGDIEPVFAVNLRGGYFTAQAAARAMVAGGSDGRIVFTTSVAGVQAIRGLGAYGAIQGRPPDAGSHARRRARLPRHHGQRRRPRRHAHGPHP